MNALCNPYCWFYLNEEILRFILMCGIENDSYEREYLISYIFLTLMFYDISFVCKYSVDSNNIATVSFCN